MRVADSLIDLIGGTPLVRLSRLGRALPAEILGKLEAKNPLGSVKDRIAWTMIRDAEERGLLEPGGVVVEPTSGNTGIVLRVCHPGVPAHPHPCPPKGRLKRSGVTPTARWTSSSPESPPGQRWPRPCRWHAGPRHAKRRSWSSPPTPGAVSVHRPLRRRGCLGGSARTFGRCWSGTRLPGVPWRCFFVILGCMPYGPIG